MQRVLLRFCYFLKIVTLLFLFSFYGILYSLEFSGNVTDTNDEFYSFEEIPHETFENPINGTGQLSFAIPSVCDVSALYNM